MTSITGNQSQNQQEHAMKTNHIEQEHDLLTLHFTQENAMNPSAFHVVTQNLIWVADSEKCSLLLDLLKPQTGTNSSTLIFVKTKHTVDMLSKFLEEHHHTVSSIHGGRMQTQREEALRSFKNGRTSILVATDIVVRGLDILNIKHIINFDLPCEIGHYRERIGRTGQVGTRGQATSFFNEKDQSLAVDLLRILCESAQEVPEWLVCTAREISKNHDHS